jgi:hypothetical protein
MELHIHTFTTLAPVNVRGETHDQAPLFPLQEPQYPIK